MSKPLKWDHILALAESRNHTVNSLATEFRYVRSPLNFFCRTCRTHFQTTLVSYRGAKKTGCPGCKIRAISKARTGVLVSERTRQKIRQSNTGKPGSLLGKTGCLHPAWKGGTYDRTKGSSGVALGWRTAVKERFGSRCALSNSVVDLECHHLNAWHAYPDQRNDVLNGVVLCRGVHRAFHKHYGYKYVTQDLFLTYALTYFTVEWLYFWPGFCFGTVHCVETISILTRVLWVRFRD